MPTKKVTEEEVERLFDVVHASKFNVGDRASLCNVLARVVELESEQLRLYNADGQFKVLESKEEVIQKRIEAAKEIDRGQATIDLLRAELAARPLGLGDLIAKEIAAPTLEGDPEQKEPYKFGFTGFKELPNFKEMPNVPQEVLHRADAIKAAIEVNTGGGANLGAPSAADLDAHAAEQTAAEQTEKPVDVSK